LIDLLQAVSTHGSISAGARALGLSYRHVWGELKRWEQELGNELLVWEKGHSARLTEFGSKLMWAEAQAQARFAPQIEALRSELERAFAVAFDPNAHVVMLYASHDHGLGALREFALLHDASPTSNTRLHLDIRFSGSVDAIRALNEGRCAMAGFHTLQMPHKGSVAERVYKPFLQPGLHKIIGFATRTQGLITANGNPLGLNSLQDIQNTRARFINRPLGSGTRVVLDELLTQAGLNTSQFPGYESSEPSHTALAHAVASGAADVGLGIEAAARAHQLHFVPLLEESYHLVCLKSALQDPAIEALQSVLRNPLWQAKLSALPGYHAWQCGEVQSLRRVLPWWDFTEKV
jgi:molybdate transport repressor ModE-like protein